MLTPWECCKQILNGIGELKTAIADLKTTVLETCGQAKPPPPPKKKAVAIWTIGPVVTEPKPKQPVAIWTIGPYRSERNPP